MNLPNYKIYIYCNNCGIKIIDKPDGFYGSQFKVCNKSCLDQLYQRYYTALLERNK